MRLTDFIASNMETILVAWESFASTQTPAAANMTPLALRDHAKQILKAVATDLSTPQTDEEQANKSMGLAVAPVGTAETAAQTHAVLRARSGFDVNQLVAEYRALRASVLSLWINACHPEPPYTVDIIRFNEAIDQAVAESIKFFNTQIENSRNLLLGMLGHDMRSPLQAITLTATFLAELNKGVEVSQAASLLIRSGECMHALLDDLVDFNRTKLGLGINIAPSDIDLASVFVDELERLRTINPHRPLELQQMGDTKGYWDGCRLQQLLRNLVTNAIKYGASGSPVHVVIRGEQEEEVVFEVKNCGMAIDASMLNRIFEPLTQATQHSEGEKSNGSLGLGLYIAREIARAHGGEVSAKSDSNETAFSVRIPRLRKNRND
jgi:signal transduction histidine kinase